MTVVILLASFLIIIGLGAPIGTGMALSSVVTLIQQKMSLSMIPFNYYASITKFLLLAIPFFILGGNIMEKAGISGKLIDFAQSLVGHMKGGLAMVCVIVACFFAAISGSGPATVAALGMITIPAMTKVGYSKGTAAALIATAGGIGIIIPPSISFVVYASIAGVSTGKLFLAGIIPGLLVGLGLVIACLLVTWKLDLVRLPKASWKTRLIALKDAFWGIMMPVIILGGIYGGIFTPTEAAAVAAVYGLIVGIFIYKTLTLKTLWETFLTSVQQSGSIMWTVGCASLMSWVMSVSGVSSTLSDLLITVSNGALWKYIVIVNIVVLIAGCFIDGNSIMFIFAPVFIPVANVLGYNLIALGVLMVVNIAIGMVTPPVGCNLYVACGLARIQVKDIIKPVVPYIISSAIVLFLISYFPQIILFLVGGK